MLRLNPLFSEGMVLQRDKPVAVWGTGAEGASVTVRCRGTRADGIVRDGKWSVTLPAMSEGGPFELFAASGGVTVIVNDVLFGDVWLSGGQSNMEWRLRDTDGADNAIAAANEPLLRFYEMPDVNYEDGQEHAGEWKKCLPDAAGEFSAVAYYFAQELIASQGVPIGIIGCYKGATSAACWMSEATLTEDPQLRIYMDEYEEAVRDLDLEAYYERDRLFHEAAAQYAERERAGLRGEALGAAPWPAPMGPRNFLRPCGMYACKLLPAVSYTLKGFIYYQGESDAGRAFLYEKLLTALIGEWRNLWRDPSLPFLFVQLAGFGCYGNPEGEHWAQLRESQSVVAERVPGVGMAVSLDCGDFDDIHPRSKQPVGRRLALLAREIVYGEPLHGRSPAFVKMWTENGTALLVFTFVGGGLMAPDGQLSGFEIAGDDGRFHPAEAVIRDAVTVAVRSDHVPAPVAVRYGWKNWPAASLFGGSGLPVGTFRTKRDMPDV